MLLSCFKRATGTSSYGWCPSAELIGWQILPKGDIPNGERRGICAAGYCRNRRALYPLFFFRQNGEPCGIMPCLLKVAYVVRFLRLPFSGLETGGYTPFGRVPSILILSTTSVRIYKPRLDQGCTLLDFGHITYSVMPQSWEKHYLLTLLASWRRR